MAWQDGEWWTKAPSQGYHWSLLNPAAHSGIDFSMPSGTPIESPSAGVVRDAQWEPWGYQIDEVVQDPQAGTITESFLHLSSLAVHKGETVSPGEVIGYSGTPPDPKYGNGPHLHFELTSGATSPYLDYSPHLPTPGQHPIDPTGFVASLRSSGAGNASAGNGGIRNPLDPKTWTDAIQGAITAPFRALGIDSVSDFLWRSGLIVVGGILVLYGLFKLFEPSVKAGVQIVGSTAMTAAKAAPLAAA